MTRLRTPIKTGPDAMPGLKLKKSRKPRVKGPKLSRLEKRYGITEAQRDSMVAAQGGVCAVCGGDNGGRTLNVDHDHKTKRVRGMLCFTCNKYLIGRRTNWQVFQSAAEYLKREVALGLEAWAVGKPEGQEAVWQTAEIASRKVRVVRSKVKLEAEVRDQS